MSTVWLDGLHSLAERYDGLLVDQYGVLHDGMRPYPGAADALAAWRAMGKRCIVLSNSGKRAAYNAARLASFGLGPMHYDLVMSSGEFTHQMLLSRAEPPWRDLGPRACALMADDAIEMLHGLPVQVVATPQQADFLLLISLPEATPLATFDDWLAQALSRRLPLVCANPDLLRLTAQGLQPAPGALAQRYAERGGEVIWVGKPHPLIYAACIQHMAGWGATRLLAVGDSLAHDVQGAAGAGLSACFIAHGLYARAFSALPTGSQRQNLLRQLVSDPVEACAHLPDWAMTSLRW